LARLFFTVGTGSVGIATSKKIGSKPKRNRVKRQFREAIRIQFQLIDSRLDYVLIVKTDASESSFERIQEETGNLFREAAERWANELEFS
jgi:ribonuclease P protein component